MTKYCVNGNKAKVRYGFGGAKDGRTYSSDNCPIDISVVSQQGSITKTFSKDYGSVPNGSTKSFSFKAPSDIPSDWKCSLIGATLANGKGNVEGYGINWTVSGSYLQGCPISIGGGRSISGNITAYSPFYSPGTPLTLSVSVGCLYSSPDKKNKVKLMIVDANGGTFEDIGNAPINYSVQCGDCPDGQCKCKAPGYPGYCCLDCGKIANEINALAGRF